VTCELEVSRPTQSQNTAEPGEVADAALFVFLVSVELVLVSAFPESVGMLAYSGHIVDGSLKEGQTGFISPLFVVVAILLGYLRHSHLY
jgi:hypothetical protein